MTKKSVEQYIVVKKNDAEDLILPIIVCDKCGSVLIHDGSVYIKCNTEIQDNYQQQYITYEALFAFFTMILSLIEIVLK